LSELHTQKKKFGKIICFENNRNHFAQNYFADSLESRFHAREKQQSSPEAERYALTSQIRRAAFPE
jgi:hypothetical protein